MWQRCAGEVIVILLCYLLPLVEEPLLKHAAQQLLGELGASSGQVQDDYIAEMCR
jgi:hypothetical protein